jgi:small-conductance mechanosensitive channel
MESIDIKSLYPAASAILALLGCFLIGKIGSRGIALFFRRRLDLQSRAIVQRLFLYTFVFLGVFLGLKYLGFDVGVLLGAAGPLGLDLRRKHRPRM